MTASTAQLLCTALLMMTAAASRAQSPDLYTADAIVTGRSEKTRLPGFQDCLREAVVRVSGDQRLLYRPELERLLPDAGNLISGFWYRDRLQGMPVHDDQGSYDRPYDLTCTFDRHKLDRLLRGLGSRPWLTPRPRLTIFMAVEAPRRSFVLAADGNEQPYMKESFLAEAASLGLEVVIPDRAALAWARLDVDGARRAGTDWLAAAAEKTAEGSRPIAGSLVWSDKELGWVADWRLFHEGRTVRWQVIGVSFDEAFRKTLRGAAQILSGNGPPQ